MIRSNLADLDTSKTGGRAAPTCDMGTNSKWSRMLQARGENPLMSTAVVRMLSVAPQLFECVKSGVVKILAEPFRVRSGFLILPPSSFLSVARPCPWWGGDTVQPTQDSQGHITSYFGCGEGPRRSGHGPDEVGLVTEVGHEKRVLPQDGRQTAAARWVVGAGVRKGRREQAGGPSAKEQDNTAFRRC